MLFGHFGQPLVFEIGVSVRHGPISHSAVTFRVWVVLIQQIAPFTGTAEFLGKNMDLLGALGAIGPLDRSYSNERGALHMLEEDDNSGLLTSDKLLPFRWVGQKHRIMLCKKEAGCNRCLSLPLP